MHVDFVRNIFAVFLVLRGTIADHSYVPFGGAKINACVPDTLGSNQYRKYQVYNFFEGKITQPFNDNLCLTATNEYTVQPIPSVRGQGWGLVMKACGEANANNTWRLSAEGQIVLTSLQFCIDIAAYQRESGSPAHLWPCTEVRPGTLPCEPPTAQCVGGENCTCVANQRFRWTSSGNVVSLNSGLCLDTGSTGNTKPKACDINNSAVFCNRSLSYYDRAKALVATANLSAKIANLGVSQPGFPLHHVQAFTSGEALHGVVTSCGQTNSTSNPGSTGCATSFPHATALGATFNRSLWSLVGDIVGQEGRAFQNQKSGGGVMYFAPNVNLCRDPRWGRCMEVPGEDPLLTGEYGARFVKAMQRRTNNGSQRVVNAPKHWLNYDMEGRAHEHPNQPNRGNFNAVVSKQEQTEYFLAQWHRVVATGQPGGIMCSTNRVNGVDACMSSLYYEILRDRFNFSGFVVTDGNSCGNANCRATVALHNASAAAAWEQEGHEIAAELCVNAGTDIELGHTLTQWTAGAVQAGMVRPADIARSNTRTYAQIVAQGHLETVPEDALGPEVVDTPLSRQLALEAATQAMVLLKNDDNMLPLSEGTKVALIGPHIDSTADLLASHGYAGENKIVANNTIATAFQRRADAGQLEIVGRASGCDILHGCDTADIASVEAAVADAEVVLAFVGLHPSSGDPHVPGYGTPCAEGEAFDRQGSIGLCGQQPQILEAAFKSGKPLVTVLINGGAISATWVKQRSTAIVEAWYPGQAGGEAVAAVMMGEASPGGRLPVTVYPESFVETRNITEMGLRTHDGLTYMHYTGTPLWPFGYGLSYTNWSLSVSKVQTELLFSTTALATAYARYHSSDGLIAAPFAWLNATVRNTGARADSVVVQVYATAASWTSRQNTSLPLRQLAGFTRTTNISPGETREVRVGLAPLAFCTAMANGDMYAGPGAWRLSATVDGISMMPANLEVSGQNIRVFEWPQNMSNTRKQIPIPIVKDSIPQQSGHEDHVHEKIVPSVSSQNAIPRLNLNLPKGLGTRLAEQSLVDE